MRFDSFKYLVKQGWHNMVANRLMTLASIGVLSACLIITGLASLISLNVNRVVDYLQNQNEIQVYIIEGTTPENQASLRQQLQALDNVREVEYVSKEEALEQMMVWMEQYDYLFEGYEDVLPASFKVTVEDMARIQETNAAIMALPFVSETQVPVEMAEVMIALKSTVNYGGWGLVAVLALVALVVISNTIRLTVFNRRREINIMKYVGATNGFIRLPFFVEGMSVGAISGLISAAIICAAYFLVMQVAHSSNVLWAAGIIASLYTFWQVWPFIVGGFLLGGILIGSLGSAGSVRKYLRV